MNVRVHGAPLVEQVIERIRRRGWNGAEPPEITNPHPLADEVIAGLRMPGGKPLPPSLGRWLRFDGGWLANFGWYDNPASPELVGGSLSEVADQMYGFGDFDTYTSLIDHPEYASRMQEHAVRTGLGPDGKDIGDLYARPADAALDEA